VSVSDRVAEPVASGPVRYEVRDTGIALITLNRPERMNGWGGGLATTFYKRLDDAAADPDVRAIVVTGSGRAFCAGADMGDLTTISTATVDAAGDTDVGKLVGARHPHVVMTMPKPVIAAINGACAGIGLVAAMNCDLRFASSTAKITAAFSRRGIMAEHGLAWSLQRVVGQSRALDLLFSGRIVQGQEALALGVVDRIFEPAELMDRTLEYAHDLAANCSPVAMGIMKQQVYQAAESTHDEARTMAIRWWYDLLRDHPDFKEGITSFLDKRPPAFAPWDPSTATEPAPLPKD
jgi:enoyl-CoA hydratase/carnithine racemase